jgi:hypothetical protein
MAAPNCPKCSSSSFEMQEIRVKGSNFKWNSIQCSSCGSVVGVVEFEYVGSLLRKFARKLGFDLDF